MLLGKGVNMIGETYNDLTVLDFHSKTGRQTVWKCLCVCGKFTNVRGNSLKSGHTKSCGCALLRAVRKHGGKGTRLHQTWINMRRRCSDDKAKDYVNYGGRGIKVTDEWSDFITFKTWAMDSGYTDDLTIDRINVDGDYAPDNCKWSDWNTQACNQRKADNTSSIYLGVSKRKNKWQAAIKVNYENHYLGTFLNERDAAIARDKFIIENNLPHKLNNIQEGVRE